MTFKHSYRYFKPEDFEEVLKLDNWYVKLLPQINKFILNYHSNKEDSTQFTEEFMQERAEFILAIGEYLRENKISVDNTHEFYFDKERKPIDTIIIHHKGRTKDADLEYIEAVELLNLYVRDFISPGKKHFKKKIFSGHIYKDRQTFLAYHYVVYRNGSFEQILRDEYIGWHCGNWDYNCRSIAIMIMDTLIDKEPSPEAVKTVNEIISKYQPKVILGHNEVKQSESCPGNTFLGEKGWKNKLRN
jgi:hypothetical protein